MRVKVCGITTVRDARLAVEAGADAIGLVFAEGSPRRVTARRATAIVRTIPPWVIPVGVFVNATVAAVAVAVRRSGLGCVQLHGDESPATCRAVRQRTGRPVVKAIRVATTRDMETIRAYRGAVDAVLLDTAVAGARGGTGKAFDWRLATRARRFGLPVILAGGLRPQTVADAIRRVRPEAVDVSSGVERRPGVKDPRKVRAFVAAARR